MFEKRLRRSRSLLGKIRYSLGGGVAVIETEECIVFPIVVSVMVRHCHCHQGTLSQYLVCLVCQQIDLVASFVVIVCNNTSVWPM